VDTRKDALVQKQQRKNLGDREDAYFESLVGSSVMLEDMSGKQFGGKLLWVGPYSLIMDRRSTEILYWKHALKSIRPANGRGEDQ
jgi:hypothetical protein